MTRQHTEGLAHHTQAARPARREHKGWALAMLLVGAILPPLDYFIVNLALPAIRSGLGASDSQLQFVISAYASANAVALITGGRLGDLYGRKRMFMIAMAGFVAASAWCGFAVDGSLLVAGRALQGLFAALLTPQVLASLRTVFTPAEQARVMGWFGMVYGIAAVLGQVGGGALVSQDLLGLGWRAVFLVNLPIGLLALAGSAWCLPESQAPGGASIDLPGTGLLSVTLGLCIYPLTRGRELGWPAWTWACLAGAALLVPVFVAVERQRERRGLEPLVAMSLVAQPVVALGLVLAFLFYSVSAFFLAFGLYVQGGLGWNPLEAGLAILPFGLGFLVAPLALPRLIARHGAYATLGAAFLLLAAGLAAAGALATPATLPWGLRLALLVAGLGQGLALPSLLRMVLAEVAPARAGMASGLVTSSLQVGAAVGAAVIGGLFFASLGARPDAAAYAHAFSRTLRALGTLFTGCALVCWLGPARRAQRTGRRAPSRR